MINFLLGNDALLQALPRFSNVGPDRRHLGTNGIRFEGIDTLEDPLREPAPGPDRGARRPRPDARAAGLRAGRVLGRPPSKIKAAEPLDPRLSACRRHDSNGRVLGLVYRGNPHRVPAIPGPAGGDGDSGGAAGAGARQVTGILCSSPSSCSIKAASSHWFATVSATHPSSDGRFRSSDLRRLGRISHESQSGNRRGS
jgi:hypothetical protein